MGLIPESVEEEASNISNSDNRDDNSIKLNQDNNTSNKKHSIKLNYKIVIPILLFVCLVVIAALAYFHFNTGGIDGTYVCSNTSFEFDKRKMTLFTKFKDGSTYTATYSVKDDLLTIFVPINMQSTDTDTEEYFIYKNYLISTGDEYFLEGVIPDGSNFDAQVTKGSKSITFKNDGTFSYSYPNTNNKIVSESGSYSRKGEKFTIKYNGASDRYNIYWVIYNGKLSVNVLAQE